MSARSGAGFALLAWTFCAVASHGANIEVGGREFVPLRRVQAEQYDVTLRLRPASFTSFVVLFAYGDDGYYEVAVTGEEIQLARILRGEKRLISRGPAPVPGAMPSRMVFRRLRDLVVVIAEDRVACRAIDSALRGGWVLAPVGPGSSVIEETTVEVRQPILFTDGFMVTEEEEALDRGWRRLAGTWRARAIRPEGAAESEAYRVRSANAFVYVGVPAEAGQFALSATGEPWWSHYSAQAAFRRTDSGGAGLAFGCERQDKFWLVRLECTSRFAAPSRFELLRVDGARREHIAEAWVNACLGDWYSVGVEISDGRVRVSFLGSLVLDVADRRITGGAIGLYAEGPGGAAFDDVVVRELDRVRVDTDEELKAFGEQRSGAWYVQRVDGAGAALVPRGDDARLVFGDDSWTGGAVTAEVRFGRSGRFGLAAGVDGPVGYILSLAADGTGELVRREGDADTVLSRFNYEAERGSWCRVGLNLSELGVVSAYVGGGLVARERVEKAARGRVGVFAARAPGVAFRELVANRSARLLAEHQIGNAVFLSDAYMSSWATEQGQWVPDDGVDRARSMPGYTFEGKNVFWRKGDYYGDYVMVLPLTIASHPAAGPGGVQPPPVHTPIRGALSLHFCLESGDLGSGYSVTAAPTAPGIYNVELRRGADVLAKAEGVRAAEGSTEVRIYNSGAYIWARAGNRELFSHRKVALSSGTRIAAVRSEAVDFDRLAVYAENLDDSPFECAPTRWRVVGDWYVANRYTCDPRWSWMGVSSPSGVAALWHRHEFPGDVTVEFYASFKMRPTQPYYCPSDLNVTLAADREDPASGYTFLVGGWKNSRTAILRNGVVVAETTEPYLPDTRDSYPDSAMLHRRWFYIKARRKGPKVELYLDNRKYLEYTDPEPLAGGKVGVWTQEQHIMVARVQVYYSRSVVPDQLVAAPKTPRPGAMTLPADVLGGARGHFFDFEADVQGWDTGHGVCCAKVERDTVVVSPRGGKASLRLTNADSPGRFLAYVPIGEVNLLACPELSFDYRIPPGVRVNLYFDVPPLGSGAGRTWFVALTGPKESTEAIRLAGEFPDVVADGRWRTTRVNIASMLRRFYPTARELRASRFRLGIDHRRTYAVSGIGGNAQGATYHIDNFLLAPASVGKVAFRWKPHRAKHLGYSVGLVNAPDAVAAMESFGVPFVSVEPEVPGLRFLLVRTVLPSGEEPGATAVVPLYNIGRGIEVAGVHPATGAAWGGEPIRIQFRPEQIAALDTASVVVALGSAEARLDGKALSMDWERGVLTLDPTQLAIRFDDGASVEGTVVAAAFGQTQPTKISWRYVASIAHDKTPPGPVLVEGYDTGDDFETQCDGWTVSERVVFGLDDSTAASGRRSLRIASVSDDGAFLVQRAFPGRSIGRWPTIEFDYRANPSVRVDLVFYARSGYSGFRFLDRTGAYAIGAIPDVVADGTWRRATVDVFDAFWRSKPFDLSGGLQWVGFADSGWPSSREGDEYHIDNFRMVPVISCRNGLELKWKANDPLGVAGYAFRWSDTPDGEAPTEVLATGGSTRFEGLAEGRAYLHIRAIDRAGNQGPSRCYTFIIDNTPPATPRITPQPGASTVPYRFTVAAPDAHGPDPAALRLVVNGQALTMSHASLTSASRSAISWDLTRVPETIQTIPNGAKVPFVLSGVRDFAGNTIDPIQGFWTMDYSRDRTPPQRVEFDIASAKVAFVRRFDRDLDGTAAHGSCRVERALSNDAESHVLLLTPAARSPYGAAFSHPPIDLAETGIVGVDVRLPSERDTYVDLLVTGVGFRCKVRMGDPPPEGSEQGDDGYMPVGVMNGAASSGWHTQWIDLYAAVKKAFPKLTSWKVSSIQVGRACEPYGARPVYLDNLMVYGYGSSPMKLKLRSRDLIGLSGYAVTVAQTNVPEPRNGKDAPTPAREVNHKGDEFECPLEPGVWYVKAYACDNNGNWSQLPGVLPYVVAGTPAQGQ